METKISLPRTRKLPARNGKTTSEKANFRRIARQVMLANMFTRRVRTQNDMKAVTSCKSAAAQDQMSSRERKHNENLTEKPPTKRRGTPELFPMSEEMKQTVISLGKLDLLPGVERKMRGDSVGADSRVEKSRSSCKFREKTRQKIIQPQRFIRHVRSSLMSSKSIPENSVHCEEKIEDITMGDITDNTRSDQDKANCTKESDGAFIRTKSNCNILSRPQSTHCHFTAKSAKNQHYSLTNKRPFSVTRFSDLGPFSTRKPTKITQGIWSTNAFDSTARMRTRAHYFPSKVRSNTFTGKAWAANSEISSEESDRNSELEMLKTRPWKSVESLTREIEEKCLSWLENRYGIAP